MDLITVESVELCSAGRNWSSAGGYVTLSMEDIADAAAAWADPLIRAPRLKIGHTDPRFADPDEPGCDPFYDGEPAFGSVHNLRLANDGAMLVGDYVNVPAWLAEVLPSAYPSRSIEGTFSAGEGPAIDGRRLVETAGGKTYRFVLTACALLGVQRPAVADLEDLRYLLTEGGGVEVTGDAETEGAEGGAMLTVKMSGMDAKLEASVDTVVDTYYDQLPEDPGSDEFWYWVRDVRVDPQALIVDDNKGSLWMVPFSTDADQVVTFDDPERVLQTYRSAPQAATSALMAAASKSLAPGEIVAAFSTRDASVPEARKDTRQGGDPKFAEVSAMNFSELSDAARVRLCKSLSLAEDATDDQIVAALNEPAEETPEAPEAPAEETPAEEEAPAEETLEETDDTTVTVDKTVLAQLQADSAAGREARDEQIAARRSAVLTAALKAGKITPASKGAWETKLKAAFAETEAELEGLPEGLVPVADSEVGHGGDTGTVDKSVALDASEEEILFPQLRGRAARES